MPPPSPPPRRTHHRPPPSTMKFKKRDAIATILLIYLLHVSFLRSSNLHSPQVTTSLSFYTEYNALYDPCHGRKISDESTFNSNTKPCWIAMAPPLHHILPSSSSSSSSSSDGDEGGGKKQQQQRTRGRDILIVPSVNNIRVLRLSRYDDDNDNNKDGNGENDIDTSLPYFPRLISKLKIMNETNSEIVPIRMAASSHSVGTIWNDGTVTLHDLSSGNASATNRIHEELFSWSMKLFRRPTDPVVLFSDEEDLMIVAAKEEEGGGGVGDRGTVSYYALTASTGEERWRHVHHDPSLSSTTSSSASNTKTEIKTTDDIDSLLLARRGEWYVRQFSPSSSELDSGKDCLHHYRQSIMKEDMSVFPHGYWNGEDASLNLVRFERTTSKHVTKSKTAPKDKNSRRLVTSLYQRRHNHHHHHHHHRTAASPNAIVAHNQFGIEILSLKNGHGLCHISLPPGDFFADVNHDETIDQVILPADGRRSEDEMDPTPEDDEDCILTSHSGIPARETLYTVSLCGSGGRGEGRTDAAKPHWISGDGLYIATNHGVITKLNDEGVISWQSGGGRRGNWGYDNPTWEDDEEEKDEKVGTSGEMTSSSSSLSSSSVGFVSDIHVPLLSPSLRPIVVAGRDRLVILSSDSGWRVTEPIYFPQESMGRPIVKDMDGDGVDDILIRSVDAIWGYKVEVTGSYGAVTVLCLGVLFLGLLMAAMVNYLGDGKRSTDL